MKTTRTTRLLLPAALAAALTLSACAGDDGDMAGMSGMESSSSSSSSPATGEAAPAEFNDADVTFAQEMIVHHTQANMMSATLLAKDGVDERVSALAQSIEAEQAPEIEQMTTWLQQWGAEVPATDEAAMEAMAEEGMGAMEGMDHSGAMPGMMSAEDMAALEAAAGPEASALFLEQMTAHHTGAIEMAQTEVEAGADPGATALAQTIVESQQDEVQQMQDLLATL